MIVALDSNVLAYFGDVARIPADQAKIECVQDLFRRMAGRVQLIAPAQALGEFYNVLLKSGATRQEALLRVVTAEAQFGSAGTSPLVLRNALELASLHKLQIWDSVILSAAAEAGASILLSEDMQDGFVWRGVRVLNPFSEHAETALFG